MLCLFFQNNPHQAMAFEPYNAVFSIGVRIIMETETNLYSYRTESVMTKQRTEVTQSVDILIPWLGSCLQQEKK